MWCPVFFWSASLVMTAPSDILWGRYKEWEGPWFRGSAFLKLPDDPSQAFKRVYVSSKSEGGFDSINMYDKCTISIGISQACETPWFLTSKLIGAIASKDEGLLAPLQPALDASNAVFRKTQRGRWRFHFLDSRGEVDAGAEQKQLFLLHSSGKRGSWDDESKAHAKLWAASMANMLVQPGAQDAQIVWASRRIEQYAMREARKILFDDAPDEGWVGAMRAAYLSFALNIPATANKMLVAAFKTAPGAKWNPEWCTHILRHMVFKSKVAIWPHRYDAVRKSVELLYAGVDLPDTSEDLEAWNADMGLEPKTSWERICEEDPYEQDVPTFTTTKEVQTHLLDLGYDLGPWGADGRMGTKTRDAIITFQRLNTLAADGIVGPATRAALQASWEATN